MDKQSDVSRALFVVGEVVILASRDYPQANGEYEVLEVVEDQQRYRCPITGSRLINCAGGRAYILDTEIVGKEGVCVQWDESCLRKRHQPGEYSFDDLKTILYLPVSRDELVRLEREVCRG